MPANRFIHKGGTFRLGIIFAGRTAGAHSLTTPNTAASLLLLNLTIPNPWGTNHITDSHYSRHLWEECMNCFKTSTFRWVILISAILLVSNLAHAQTFRGTILGTVIDSTGAAIPGAQVVVKNLGTSQTRTTTSGDAGTYTVPELPVGQYAVTVSKEGFDSMTMGGVDVTVASER